MCDINDAKHDPTWHKAPLGVRWVDIDKPGKGYRSRLVAKDFNSLFSVLIETIVSSFISLIISA